MSHHLDSPLARSDSRLDLTDLYLFQGEQGLTMIMNMNSSAYADQQKPGFHPEARYEFKVHLGGSAYEEVTYRFEFDPPGATGRQAVRVRQLLGDEARRDEAPGRLVAEGGTGATIDGDDGMRVYTGEVADPFYLDLRQLAAIEPAVAHATMADLRQWWTGPAENSFADATVQSIVVEFPVDGPFPPHSHIGVWAVSKLATDDGGWRQINRMANPMVWPIFRPHESAYASEANELHPSEDLAVDGKRIAELTAGVCAAYGTANPDVYGEVLAARLLPDIQAYHVGTPAGVTMVRTNGRTLADNVAEVMFSLATNTAVSSRIAPESTAASRQDLFPYVVPA